MTNHSEVAGLDITQLCSKYHLGEQIQELRPVTGGLLHRIFMLKTTKGAYAVKLLNPEIMKRSTAFQN